MELDISEDKSTIKYIVHNIAYGLANKILPSTYIVIEDMASSQEELESMKLNISRFIIFLYCLFKIDSLLVSKLIVKKNQEEKIYDIDIIFRINNILNIYVSLTELIRLGEYNFDSMLILNDIHDIQSSVLSSISIKHDGNVNVRTSLKTLLILHRTILQDLKMGEIFTSTTLLNKNEKELASLDLYTTFDVHITYIHLFLSILNICSKYSQSCHLVNTFPNYTFIKDFSI